MPETRTVPYLTLEEAHEKGYQIVRILPGGCCCAVQRMIFTCALMVGLTDLGWETHFCFHTPEEAVLSLIQWDGAGDPPGNWIKQKPEGRMNPNYKPPRPDIE